MSVYSFSTRCLVAALFALGIDLVVLSLITGGDGPSILKLEQDFTRRQIKHSMKAVDVWKAEHGKYPTSSQASDLFLMHDGWGRPFRYSLVNRAPFIESLGRDGKRGGVGLDADLSNFVPHPTGEKMSRWQQLEDPFMRRLELVTLLCALMAGTLVFWGLSEETMRPMSWLRVGVSLSITFVMAAYGSLLIAIVHISGH